MVHVYHDKDCPDTLTNEQHKSCQNSRAQHFGPQTLMYFLWERRMSSENITENEYEEEENVKVER